MSYTIKKTKPKKGLPNGAWVCFNHEISPFKQLFGDTPNAVLRDYLHWESEQYVRKDTKKV